MPVSGSQMGQGPSGSNPPPKYKNTTKGAKLVNAIRPLKKKRKKRKKK